MNDRPITKHDFLRVYSLLVAMSAHHKDDPDGPDDLVETLKVVYEDYPGGAPFINEIVDDPVPERVIARELTFGCRLLEALWRGSDRIPEKISVSVSPCAVPGCPELTYGGLCWVHELEKRKDE